MLIAYKKNNNRELIASISVFLYFISILLLFIVDNNIPYRKVPYHFFSALCVVEFFLFKLFDDIRLLKINKTLVIFIGVCFITGAVNSLIIGNSTLLNAIECSFINTFIACLIIERRIEKKWFEWVSYVYVGIFVLRIIENGLFQRITVYSNNQVSVALIIPVVVYYVMADIYEESPRLMPALTAWIIALLARGRSGIAAFTILFFVVYIYKNKKSVTGENKYKVILTLLERMVLIFGGVFALYYLYVRFSDELLLKFYERGVDNSARAVIWGEYFETAFTSWKYFLLGVPKRLLKIGTLYAGNTHNSFISIHANNGIVLLLFMLGLMLNGIRLAVKNRRFLYLICLLVFSFRSFFDNAFWGTWGTTSFMYMILLPLLIY